MVSCSRGMGLGANRPDGAEEGQMTAERITAEWLERVERIITDAQAMRETGVGVEERHMETMKSLRLLATHMREDIEDPE